ncbi:hypothetical protein C8R45DRAFT_1115233 [Mycena sanguinolenta]|nr:hypothetical protein C8R45DRAFT_1115233 [Mycena sanguinolenta]
MLLRIAAAAPRTLTIERARPASCFVATTTLVPSLSSSLSSWFLLLVIVASPARSSFLPLLVLRVVCISCHDLTRQPLATSAWLVACINPSSSLYSATPPENLIKEYMGLVVLVLFSYTYGVLDALRLPGRSLPPTPACLALLILCLRSRLRSITTPNAGQSRSPLLLSGLHTDCTRNQRGPQHSPSILWYLTPRIDRLFFRDFSDLSGFLHCFEPFRFRLYAPSACIPVLLSRESTHFLLSRECAHAGSIETIRL